MNHNENTWEHLLKIKTSGRDDSEADPCHYPYEPTPYSVLERLANSEYIGKRNVLIDYGCGKGRVDFFAFGVNITFGFNVFFGFIFLTAQF